MLDLGCGFGWHCQYAVDRGARSVVGIDISEKMLAVAEEKTFQKINYLCMPIEDAVFPEASLDIVTSSLVFHYIELLSEIIRKIYGWLTGGGEIIFSVEHPVFTASGEQDWYRDAGGQICIFRSITIFLRGNVRLSFSVKELLNTTAL